MLLPSHAVGEIESNRKKGGTAKNLLSITVGSFIFFTMEVVSLLSDSDDDSADESSKKETRSDSGAKRPASANSKDALIVIDSDGDECGEMITKRKSKSDQSTSTTLSSSVSSYSSSPAWVCNACTFKNQKPLALACEMCAVPRATADDWAQKESHSIPNNNWTCSRCTLLNPIDQNACSVCDHPNEGGGDGEVKSKISKSFTSAAEGQVQRKRPMDNERRLQMARWKEDRENSISSKKRPRQQSSFGYEQTTTGRTEISNIDFRALAAARSQRQQQGLSSDSAARGDGIHMPGEMGISTLRYWDLTAKSGLCTAGQRHLATIKNALSHRTPSVILRRAQYLSNPPLVRKFEVLKARLTRSHEVAYLFHGTGSQNIVPLHRKAS